MSARVITPVYYNALLVPKSQPLRCVCIFRYSSTDVSFLCCCKKKAVAVIYSYAMMYSKEGQSEVTECTDCTEMVFVFFGEEISHTTLMYEVKYVRTRLSAQAQIEQSQSATVDEKSR